MKRIKLKLFLASLAMLAVMGSCRSNRVVTDTAAYSHFETSYINNSPSGSITVRAWGNGPNKAVAIEEAKKNAVADVIFKGVKGSKGYSGQPIVTEVNARERYAEYFDRFFADGGEYGKFAKETSNSDKSRTKAKTYGREGFGVTLDINRPALVRQLAEDGVIKR